jgi:hypothetical protein
MSEAWPISDKEAALPDWLTRQEAAVYVGRSDMPAEVSHRRRAFFHRAKLEAMPGAIADRDALRRYIRARESDRLRVSLRMPSGNVVYFIEAVGLDRVKIGWSTNLRQRVTQLRMASAVPLRVLFHQPGDVERERELHARFADLRVHGEWFTLASSIRSYIAVKHAERVRLSRPEGAPL